MTSCQSDNPLDVRHFKSQPLFFSKSGDVVFTFDIDESLDVDILSVKINKSTFSDDSLFQDETNKVSVLTDFKVGERTTTYKLSSLTYYDYKEDKEKTTDVDLSCSVGKRHPLGSNEVFKLDIKDITEDRFAIVKYDGSSVGRKFADVARNLKSKHHVNWYYIDYSNPELNDYPEFKESASIELFENGKSIYETLDINIRVSELYNEFTDVSLPDDDVDSDTSKTYKVNVPPVISHGQVYLSKSEGHVGDIVIAPVIPDEGYETATVRFNDDLLPVKSDDTYRFRIVEGLNTFMVTFKPIKK